ncbi:ABC transporter permease [Nitrospirillum iridis]|uniref:Putative ABC transport system permease protein n=1 Tax=Nitrospirillum iridis TaxID=765888 RepID=A0A7X0AXP9_9PROT|nr:ABC transporter permease [Nitrospirillum iridis]MBB6250581.1 putative ABC transport system permease protein [Nitrospirillum iridis]
MMITILRQAAKGVRRTRSDVLLTFAGMIVGLTASLLMALLVRDQVTYGHAFPHHERTYLLSGTLSAPGEALTPLWSTPARFAELMPTEIPGVEAVARLNESGMEILRREDAAFREMIAWADPSLFEVLPVPVVAGDPVAALTAPDGLVLTQSLATKLLRPGPPLGQVVRMRGLTFRVMAVLADQLQHGPLRDFAAFFPNGSALSPLRQGDDANRVSTATPSTFQQVYTYFRMRAGISTPATDAALAAFLTRQMPADDRARVTLRALRVDRIQLDPELNGNRRAQLFVMLAIASLTLAIPCINFVTLATARASRRRIEVGIAKMGGAHQHHLTAQFVLESILLVGLAMVAAISLTELVLPAVNGTLGIRMTLDLTAPDVMAIILGLVLVVGVLAGLYPALVLAAHRPAAVLKGGGATVDHSTAIRQGLVVGQFMLLIPLLSVTLAVHRQQDLLTHARLSYDPSQVVVVEGVCRPGIRDRLAAVPGVRTASCAGMETLMPEGVPIVASAPGGVEKTISTMRVDASFLLLFGIPPLAGRLFDAEHSRETADTILLNETAARGLGWSRPETAVGQTIRVSVAGESGSPAQVVGIIPDFSMGSLEDKVPPMLFQIRGAQLEAQESGLIYLKLAGGDPHAALAGIDAALRADDPGIPVSRFFFDEHLAMLTRVIRTETQIFTLFSVVNLLMACAGIYGLSAFTAERRTKEIGVRKVYGASVTDIVRLLLWQFAKPVLLAGMLVWIPTYLGLRRWLEGFATHVEVGPLSLLAATALALVIAGLTVAGQSMWVARAKPIRALRYE